MTLPTSEPAAKSALRRQLLRSRRAVPAVVRADDARALAGWMAGLCGTVCAYVPIGSEPGSVESKLPGSVESEPESIRPEPGTIGPEPGSIGPEPESIGPEPGASGSVAMLDALVAAGCTVLLPVVTGPEPLDWAVYQGPSALTVARFGLLEPLGPRLGVSAVSAVSTVLVPALAVDRLGVRLGRGGGHYDRTLPLAGRGAELIAVVRDSELVDALPREPHDIPMTAALTPTAGLTPLGTR